MTPLYPRILGAAFDRLPEAVRRFHSGTVSDWHGEGHLTLGPGLWPGVARRLAGYPTRGGPMAISVRITSQGDHGAERWERWFGAHRTVSLQAPRAGAIEERLGPVRLRLALTPTQTGLGVGISGAGLGPVPLPLALVPTSRATERQDAQGRFAFDVAGFWPGQRAMIHYTGWLVPGRICNA